MASTNLYLDQRGAKGDKKALKEKEWPIKVGVSHRSIHFFISTGVSVLESQWSKRMQSVYQHPEEAFLNGFLLRRRAAIHKALLMLMEDGRLDKMSSNGIKNFVLVQINQAKCSGHSILEYMDKKSCKLSPSTISSYMLAKKELIEFCGGEESVPYVDEVDSDWIERFSDHMKIKGFKHNSIVTYMGKVRAAFSLAIKDEVIAVDPFVKYEGLRHEKTRKRNLLIEDLAKIARYNGRYSRFRDIFLLMFYLRGINVVDLFALTSKNIENGRIEYSRAKTGGQYSVKIEPEAKAILDKYRGKSHLLWVSEYYSCHRSMMPVFNTALKRIAKDVGIEENIARDISSYWVRHTWATIAHKCGVSKDAISLALGHSFGVGVTDVYIEFDNDIVDNANRLVIDALNKEIDMQKNR